MRVIIYNTVMEMFHCNLIYILVVIVCNYTENRFKYFVWNININETDRTDTCLLYVCTQLINWKLSVLGG